MIMRQCAKAYKTIGRNGLRDTMNAQARLTARLKAIGECDYGAIVMMFTYNTDTDKWEHSAAYEVTGNGRFVRIENEYAAIGCDKAIALGALHAGASADGAVRAAAAHGVYTAMPMHVVKIGVNDRVFFTKESK